MKLLEIILIVYIIVSQVLITVLFLSKGTKYQTLKMIIMFLFAPFMVIVSVIGTVFDNRKRKNRKQANSDVD